MWLNVNLFFSSRQTASKPSSFFCQISRLSSTSSNHNQCFTLLCTREASSCSSRLNYFVLDLSGSTPQIPWQTPMLSQTDEESLCARRMGLGFNGQSAIDATRGIAEIVINPPKKLTKKWECSLLFLVQLTLSPPRQDMWQPKQTGAVQYCYLHAFRAERFLLDLITAGPMNRFILNATLCIVPNVPISIGRYAGLRKWKLFRHHLP